MSNGLGLWTPNPLEGSFALRKSMGPRLVGFVISLQSFSLSLVLALLCFSFLSICCYCSSHGQCFVFLLLLFLLCLSQWQKKKRFNTYVLSPWFAKIKYKKQNKTIFGNVHGANKVYQSKFLGRKVLNPSKQNWFQASPGAISVDFMQPKSLFNT